MVDSACSWTLFLLSLWPAALSYSSLQDHFLESPFLLRCESEASSMVPLTICLLVLEGKFITILGLCPFLSLPGKLLHRSSCAGPFVSHVLAPRTPLQSSFSELSNSSPSSAQVCFLLGSHHHMKGSYLLFHYFITDTPLSPTLR